MLTRRFFLLSGGIARCAGGFWRRGGDEAMAAQTFEVTHTEQVGSGASLTPEQFAVLARRYRAAGHQPAA